MHKSIKHIPMLWLALAFCCGSVSVIAADDDEDVIEEVIVTGSYIRRDNFDIPSPIDVVTELDLELAGTADLGDIIFDQTFQSGVNANATPFEGESADDQQWNQGQEVWANLRGLGTRATMTMIDGHRLPADTNTWGRRAGVDINGTYPSNAIGRVETILDGASALYGAEAVGGVINLIPKKDFEGVEISYDIQQALDGGSPSESLGVLFGVQGDRGGAIFAVELKNQERMRITERPKYILAPADPWLGQDYVAWWHDPDIRSVPGTFAVPMRNDEGDLVPVAEGDVWLQDAGGAWAQHLQDQKYGATPLGPGYRNVAGMAEGDGIWSWNNATALGHVTTGQIFGVLRPDPGCAYGFAAGHDDWGTPPDEFKAASNTQGVEGNRFLNGNFAYNDLTKHGNFMNGWVNVQSNTWYPPRCRMTISDMQDMQAESDHNKAMAYFEYEINDYVKLRGEVVISSNDYNTRDVTGGFDEHDDDEFHGPLSAVVIGHNPGNPFRAYADGSTYDPTGVSTFAGITNGFLDWEDANGDGLYQYGTEAGEYYLFAPDSDGDGRPDRTYAVDGSPDVSGLAQADVRAEVILFSLNDTDDNGVPDRFDETWALANGGVRLFEDVRVPYNELNVFPKQPRNNTFDGAYNDDGILVYKRRFIRENLRIRLGAEIIIPNTDWIIDADYIWAKGHRSNNYPEPLIYGWVHALRCQGGFDLNDLSEADATNVSPISSGGTGNCWNPFSTTYLNSTVDGQLTGDESIKFPTDDDPGWRPFYSDEALGIVSPEVNTEEENRNAGVIFNYQLQDIDMKMVDLVASTGNMFELPWNDEPVGFALGVHYRIEGEEYRPSQVNQAGIGGGRRGWRISDQTTTAVFGEIQLPLIESPTFGSMELQLAVRYAEIETVGRAGQEGQAKFTTTIPKIAVRYSPWDWLAFRGSKTEGFVTPGLYAMFGTPLQYSGQGTSAGAPAVVSDYICDYLPEIVDCQGASIGGSVPDVASGSTPNANLDAETSDLWNAGISLRLLDGDLVLDLDYTSVEFNGRVEQIGGSINVRSNEIGFEDYLEAACPGTVADWDNALKAGADPDLAMLTIDEYRLQTSQAELDCRVAAAISWVTTDAKGGLGESGIGGSALQRGDGINGLGLSVAESPWVEQGAQETETMIYALRYSFDAEQIPFIGGNYGSFTWSLSATQMVTQAITRYASFGCPAELKTEDGICPGDHPYAGIRYDGVGNANRGGHGGAGPGLNLQEVLAPTPEWRVNSSLRWFRGNHTAQLAGRWHDGVSNVNGAWNLMIERGFVTGADAEIPEKDRCIIGPSCIGSFGAEAYWDVSYTYRRPDVMGMNLSLNLSVRNILDNMPTPRTIPAGFEGYLDNIMGRIGFARLTLSL